MGRDQAAASIGLGIGALVAYLLAAGIIALLFFALSPLGGAGLIITIAVGVTLVVAIALLFSRLEGIYKPALHSYATNGEIPSFFYFKGDVIRDSFSRR